MPFRNASVLSEGHFANFTQNWLPWQRPSGIRKEVRVKKMQTNTSHLVKKNRENRSSRSSDNVSQLITRKRKKLKQAKCIARSASLPSGLNKKRYVPPLIETCHEGANVSSPYALVLSRLHVRKVCDDKSYSNTIGLWSAAFIPSFGGTSINAIAFPCIGQSFLIVSRSSSSLTSISSAKLTHTQRKV